MKRYLVACGLALFSIGMASAQQYDKPFELKSNGYSEKKMKKAPKKIYIASFRTYFHVTASAQAKSTGGRDFGGGSYSGDTKTSMTVGVRGVDNPDFQEMTDQLYNEFVADLKSKGFEIVSADVAGKAPLYEGWERKEGGTLSSTQIKGYVMGIPTGYSYYVKKTSNKGREKSTMTDRTPRLSKQLDDIIVAEVAFGFPFIDMKTNSNDFVGFSSVKAKVNFRMGSTYAGGANYAAANQNYIKFVTGISAGAAADAYCMYIPKKDVKIDGVFEDNKFKSVTTASSTPAYGAIVFTTDQEQALTHEAKCDNEKYKEAVMKLSRDFMNQSLGEFYGVANK